LNVEFYCKIKRLSDHWTYFMVHDHVCPVTRTMEWSDLVWVIEIEGQFIDF